MAPWRLGCPRTRTGWDRTAPSGVASASRGLLPDGEHETEGDSASDPPVAAAFASGVGWRLGVGSGGLDHSGARSAAESSGLPQWAGLYPRKPSIVSVLSL